MWRRSLQRSPQLQPKLHLGNECLWSKWWLLPNDMNRQLGVERNFSKSMCKFNLQRYVANHRSIGKSFKSVWPPFFLMEKLSRWLSPPPLKQILGPHTRFSGQKSNESSQIQDSKSTSGRSTEGHAFSSDWKAKTWARIEAAIIERSGAANAQAKDQTQNDQN